MPRRSGRLGGGVNSLARVGERAQSPGGSPFRGTPFPGRARRGRAGRGGGMVLRSRRHARRRTTASRLAFAALAAPALALALAVPLAAPAVAEPSDQPGGTTAVLDSDALDRLQQRAAEVQDSLRAQEDDIVAAREQLDQAQADVADAEAVVADADGELARYQAVVAQYASAVYRDGGELTPFTLLLSGKDPGEVLSALSFLDVVDQHAADVIGAAESLRRQAVDVRRRADAALDRAQARADEVADRVADLEAQASAVADELDQALSVVDKQLAELQQEQVQVNEQTAANWKAYVDQLTAAGVTPPPASALLAPESGLPDGLVPVASREGGA